MGDSEAEDKKKISHNFDIKNELSTLVEKNVIPSKIAEKLGQKLKENEVIITKDQFNNLVEKINTILSDYSKLDYQEKKITPEKITKQNDVKTDTNMQKLIETIEKLEVRINNIENDLINKSFGKGKASSTKVVTTDDINIPEDISQATPVWTIDPLNEVPSDPESIVVLMKWLQYLIDKCGRENLSNILDYYVDIGWISQNAKISLIDYSYGITEEGRKGETPTTKNDLPSRDHIQSLIFIQKLKGREFDRHFLERIDDELTRITKKLDNYNFK